MKLVLALFYLYTCCFARTALQYFENVEWGQESKLIEEVRARAFKCKDGRIEGNVLEILMPIFDECQKKVDDKDRYVTAKIGICVMNKFGLVDPEGAPNVMRMHAFVHVMYSPELLKSEPSLALNFHSCTHNYIIGYHNAILPGNWREWIYPSFMAYDECIAPLNPQLHRFLATTCARASVNKVPTSKS